MARPKRERKSVRLNLELPETVRARLEVLVEKSESDTLTEVVRKALAVYDVLLQNKERGGKTLLLEKDGSEREVVLT
jgi:hypothetical protein